MPLSERKRIFKAFAFVFIFIILFTLYRHSVFFNLTYQIPLSPFNPTSVSKNSEAVVLKNNDCDQSIWNHVYLPERLYLIKPCVALEGTVKRMDLESDGDNHIYFKVDQKYPQVINFFNQVLAGGNIIAEVVCMHNERLDIEAEKSCKSYENKIIVPKVGTHIKMSGSLVLDKDVGWIEIHPVTSISVE